MKQVNQSHLPVAALTHPGMRGKNNEDRYGVTAFVLEDGRRTPALLAVLSDGIGGHRSGEVAAEIAINRISAYVAEFAEGSDPPRLLQAAVRSASQSIYDQAHTSPQYEGMGATCACAFIIENRLYTASVGDSRIYLLHDGELRQLTTDHTWIQEALTLGVITPEQVPGHPNAHVIRQFLGSPYPPEGDIRLRLTPGEDDPHAVANQGWALQAGDVVLLTSDGLTDLVNDAEIAAGLQKQPLSAAVQELIDLANARGGHDNITVIAIRIPASAIPRARSRLRPWLIGGCAALLLAGALLIAAALGLWEWGHGVAVATPTPTTTAAPALTRTLPAGQASPAAATRAPSPTAPLIPVLTVTSAPPGSPAATYTPWPTNTRVP